MGFNFSDLFSSLGVGDGGLGGGGGGGQTSGIGGSSGTDWMGGMRGGPRRASRTRSKSPACQRS
jgi:hypothetical protein